MRRMYIRGLLAGLGLGMLFGILFTQFTPVDYSIETLATPQGITYFVTYHTWTRTDLLFMSDDPNFAWTMWFYLKAQAGDFDMEDLEKAYTPQGQDGVYNPDDLANRKAPTR